MKKLATLLLLTAAPAGAAPLDDVAVSLRATTSLSADFTQTGADGKVQTGKMILARLELGLASATTYPSPLGLRPRSTDDVRRAMRALGDPRTRLAAEPFARAGLSQTSPDPWTRVVVDAAAGDDAANDDDADIQGRFDVGAWLWWRA